jgi:hypothetical protein
MPKRIRLSRAKGWRKPPDTVTVSRPSAWGNPFRVGVHGDAAECVAKYRRAWEAALKSANTSPYHPPMPFGVPLFLGPLRGKDLACWCPLDQPCHADVLLEIANR